MGTWYRLRRQAADGQDAASTSEPESIGAATAGMAQGSLLALGATLNLRPDATRAPLLDAMKHIIVGKAAYVGRFRQQLPTENSQPPQARVRPGRRRNSVSPALLRAWRRSD